MKMHPRTGLLVLAAASVPAVASAAVEAPGDGSGHVHNAYCGHSSSGGARFNAEQFWTRTATDGAGIAFGESITLTWSIVPDGTNWFAGDGSSDLVSFFDSLYGDGPGGSDLTQRPWFGAVESSFDRWGQLGGVDYVYEANDDGSSGSSSINNGVLGVRGDVRLGGGFIDGNSNVLAFNAFPGSGGDMTFDTGDNFYNSTAGNLLRLRNVTMHEHGHGLGFAHTDSNNAAFLMEPFIQLGFDGPQLDDIRGFQLLYGDALEKDGGNDTTATATFLGNANAAPLAIGTDAPTGGPAVEVTPDQSDFISLNSDADVDVFAFEVDANSQITLTLDPRGATYNQGPQGGSQFTTDTTDDVDLDLALIDSDGVSVLATAAATEAGFSEAILALVADAGTYYARVTGTGTNIQLYSLGVSAIAVPEPATAGVLALAGLALRRRRS